MDEAIARANPPLSSSDSYIQDTPTVTSTSKSTHARAFMFGSIVSQCSELDLEFDELDTGGGGGGGGGGFSASRVDSVLSLDEIVVNTSTPTPLEHVAAPPPTRPPSPYARRAIHATAGDWRQLCARLGLPARLAGGVADVEVTPRVLSIATWHNALAAIRAEEILRTARLGGGGSGTETDAATKAVFFAAAERVAGEEATGRVLASAVEVALARASVTSANVGGGGGEVGSSSSGIPAANALSRPALPAALARATLASLIPTAAPEPERVAAAADAAFARHMRALSSAKADADAHRLLRRHIFCICRIPRGDVWYPAALGAGKAALGGGGSGEGEGITTSKNCQYRVAATPTPRATERAEQRARWLSAAAAGADPLEITPTLERVGGVGGQLPL
jgi:hypothetical protein